MGKINGEFLAISGVQSILNVFNGKHWVEFHCTDFSLGDFRNVAVSSPTDRIQIKAWIEKDFLKSWKEDYGNRRNPISFFSRDNKTEAFKFFEKRMSSKKIPVLPGLLDLDENATLDQILAKSEELKYPIVFDFYPLSKKKSFQVSAANPFRLERGPTKKFHPAWAFDEFSDVDDDEFVAGVHPNLILNRGDEKVTIIVLMDEDFGNPCFHDIVRTNVNRETDVIQEMMEFVKSHAIPESIEYIDCNYYCKGPVQKISHIEGNIVCSFQNSVGSLSYKPDFEGKEIFKKILEVTPEGTLLHPVGNSRKKKSLEILSLSDGKPEQVYKEGVLILECGLMQILVYEGRVFVRQLNETLSKDCFEIDGRLREVKEIIDATLKSLNSNQDDLSSSSPKEGEKEEESTIISSSSSPTQKAFKDGPKVVPKQLKPQGPKSQKPRICSSSTATAEQISGNFNQKTNQKKGSTQKPDIGNQGNQDPSGTKSQGKPKFVLVDVDEKSKIKKGNKKPNKTRKDVERRVPDKTKIDMIRLSLIATVFCLIGAGIWFVRGPGEKGEFIDGTQRRLSRSHKNKEPKKKKK